MVVDSGTRSLQMQTKEMRKGREHVHNFYCWVQHLIKHRNILMRIYLWTVDMEDITILCEHCKMLCWAHVISTISIFYCTVLVISLVGFHICAINNFGTEQYSMRIADLLLRFRLLMIVAEGHPSSHNSERITKSTCITPKIYNQYLCSILSRH